MEGKLCGRNVGPTRSGTNSGVQDCEVPTSRSPALYVLRGPTPGVFSNYSPGVAFVNTVLVGILTILGVWFAWRQLVIAQAESVGRTTMISSIPQRQADGAVDRDYAIKVWSHGPGKLHAARLDITHAGLENLHSDRVALLDSSTPPIEWDVRLTEEQAANAWLVLSWGATRTTLFGRPMLVSEAVRTRLNLWDEIGQRPAMEVWRYRKPFWFWNSYENHRRRWLLGSGRQRQLGEYKTLAVRPRKLSQGPFVDPTVPNRSE